MFTVLPPGNSVRDSCMADHNLDIAAAVVAMVIVWVAVLLAVKEKM